MGRLFLIVGMYSCAATALAPAFCMAGLLPHPCESTHESPCEHESDCSSDPCNAVYVRPDFTDSADLEPQSDCLHLKNDQTAALAHVMQIRYESPPLLGFALKTLAVVILII